MLIAFIAFLSVCVVSFTAYMIVHTFVEYKYPKRAVEDELGLLTEDEVDTSKVNSGKIR